MCNEPNLRATWFLIGVVVFRPRNPACDAVPT